MKTSGNQSGRPCVILLSGYRGLAETFLNAFTEKGHSVSVLVRRPEAIASLEARFPLTQFVGGDCASETDCRRWIDLALERFKKVDVLVNNAAITGPVGRWHELSIDEVRKSIAINLLSPLFLSQLCLSHFLEQGKGMILNLSGGGATAARPHFISYAMAKCALVRATESLALEYPELRFYAISPGALKTPLLESVVTLDPAQVGPEYEQIKRRLEQGGEDPTKAAELALWLIETAPQHLNGKLLSALWDDYRSTSSAHTLPSWWTLRRVDEPLLKHLREENL